MFCSKSRTRIKAGSSSHSFCRLVREKHNDAQIDDTRLYKPTLQYVTLPSPLPTLRAPDIANRILSLEASYAPDASTSLFAQVSLALYPTTLREKLLAGMDRLNRTRFLNTATLLLCLPYFVYIVSV